MKIHLAPRCVERGTALLVALFLCLILSVSIAGYMKHASQQNYLSMRSQSWNTSIAVTEAGIEDALAHLNANSANLNTAGWTAAGSTYSVTRTLSSTTSYRATINASSMSQPVITAQAYVNAATLALNDSPTPIFAVGNATVTPVGSANVTTVAPSTVSRAVRVTAGKSGLFLKALVAKHAITMNGNGVTADSFNSSDPAHSTNGTYPAGVTAMLLDGGDVASNDGSIGIVDVGNANIYGHVNVGPNGTISLGPNGAVGTHSWQAGHSGIQSGYFAADMNFTFPQITLPYTTSGLTPSSGTVSNFSYATSTASVTSSTYPSPVPAGGVQTNVSYATVSSPPSPVPYGTTTNKVTTPTTSQTYPAAGTYVGTVTTSNSVTTTTTPPTNGTYSGSVTTNTTVTTSQTNPTAGTYLGTVTTSTQRIKGKDTTVYTYNLITGYTYTLVSYFYAKITSYTYTYPTYTYTYNTSTTATNLVSVASYNYILNGGDPALPPVDYYLGSLSGTIYVRGNARLVVNGNSSVGGLTLASDGVLAMYLNGTSLNIAGNTTMNGTGYAQRLQIYCTDNVTSLSMSGNSAFTGCLYAPNANLALNGGGNNSMDFIGAIIINSVTMNGHFSFHYDEALKNLNNGGRYIITTWDEIPVSQAGN